MTSFAAPPANFHAQNQLSPNQANFKKPRQPRIHPRRAGGAAYVAQAPPHAAALPAAPQSCELHLACSKASVSLIVHTTSHNPPTPCASKRTAAQHVASPRTFPSKPTLTTPRSAQDSHTLLTLCPVSMPSPSLLTTGAPTPALYSSDYCGAALPTSASTVGHPPTNSPRDGPWSRRHRTVLSARPTSSGTTTCRCSATSGFVANVATAKPNFHRATSSSKR